MIVLLGWGGIRFGLEKGPLNGPKRGLAIDLVVSLVGLGFVPVWRTASAVYCVGAELIHTRIF